MKTVVNCAKMKSRIFQYLAALAANLGMLSTGLHYGWPSSSVPVLTSGNYTFQMTDSEVSWLVAVSPLGAVVGDILAGFALNVLGRKKMIWYSSIPLTISWLLIGFATSSTYLFVARIIAGITDGLLFTAIPPYLAEIADPEIRGFIGSTYFATLVLGMLIANVLLFFMSIPTAAYISSTVSLTMMVILPFLPESPYFYLIKKQTSSAEISLKKFRGTEDVTEELKRISDGIIEEESHGTGSFKELFNSHNRNCLLLALGITSLTQLSGILGIQAYCEIVFNETSHILSANVANLLYYVTYLVATIVALFLVDVSGRRPLSLLSTGVVCVTLFVTGTFLYIKNSTSINVANYEYVQIVAILVYIAAFSLGLNYIPLLVSSEIFPSHIKGKAFCILNVCYSLTATGVIKYFSWANEMYGLVVPFYTFGIFTLIGLIFLAICLPETKGKTLEGIQLEMKSRKTKHMETNVVI